MLDVFVYLLKINVAISLFYCGYYFFLKKLTFYSVNRFYFLFSILISVIFPFLSFPPIFSKPEIISYNLPVVESTIKNLPQTENTSSLVWLILTAIYWFIVFLAGVRLLSRLISLHRIHLKSSPKLWKGYKFNTLNLHTTPFSFFRNTYLNFNEHTAQELITVLKHESVHTKNLHSLDILLMEIWAVFSWFNPISWLLKKAVMVNVEFIADDEVIRQGVSYQHYQKSLLDFVTRTQHIPLTNQFSFISLKSRINMMNKKQSSKKQLGMCFLIIPCIVASLFVFGISKAYQGGESLEIDLQEQLFKNDTTLRQDTVPRKKENIETVVRGIASELEKALIIVDGVELKDGIKDGKINVLQKEIESIAVLKGESGAALYGKKGENGVILITTKERIQDVSGEGKVVLSPEK